MIVTRIIATWIADCLELFPVRKGPGQECLVTQ